MKYYYFGKIVLLAFGVGVLLYVAGLLKESNDLERDYLIEVRKSEIVTSTPSSTALEENPIIDRSRIYKE